MARRRFPPTDPREWLRRAKLNLARSKHVLPQSDYEDYCFDGQQAAEKAIKAVFIHRSVPYRHIHNLGQLLKDLATAGVRIPKYLIPIDELTRYAVMTRYPGLSAPVTVVKYRRAIGLAERAVKWAERQIK
jgi:HEPN domain-containing protein